MTTIYYKDPIELEELIINEETFVYLVQYNHTQEFSLKAIKKDALGKIAFDPTTRAPQYWPVDLNTLLAMENNVEAGSKIFSYEQNSQKLILSSASLTRIEVNDLLKIDPIADHSNEDTLDDRVDVIRLHSIRFLRNESASEETLPFVISIIYEETDLYDRFNPLWERAQVAYRTLDSRNPAERLPMLAELGLIKTECEELQHKIHKAFHDLRDADRLYPDPTNAGKAQFLRNLQSIYSILGNTIDKKCSEYAEENRNNDCIHAITHHCMTFFKNMIPALPLDEPSFPYNRTRARL